MGVARLLPHGNVMRAVFGSRLRCIKRWAIQRQRTHSNPARHGSPSGPSRVGLHPNLATNKYLTAREIHERLASRRRRKGMAAPHITNVSRAMRGKTYKRGGAETRGRKRKLSTQALRKINAARKSLIQKATGEQEVRWSQILKALSALASGEDEFPYVSVIGYTQARQLRLLCQRRLNGESEFPYMSTIGYI